MVSTLKRRKKGRDTVMGVPSRIEEMKLHEAKAQEDPRARAKKLRDAMRRKAAGAPPPAAKAPMWSGRSH